MSEQLEQNITLKKEIGYENFIFLALFLAFFLYLGSIMGGVNMIQTLMETAFDLLINVCLYLMGVAVLAGALSGLFSEFGTVALLNRMVSPLMRPIYGLPGASSLGILNCYLSDNPAILTLADDDNFRRYFRQYQLPALTNLGTAFGMGLITTTTMMGLNVPHAIPAALLGNLGAVVGGVVSVRMMLFFSRRVYGTERMTQTKIKAFIPEKTRVVRTGGPGSRFIQALLEGGKSGVNMGVAIIPGVLIICTLVIILTNGPGEGGVYTGASREGVALLPAVGAKLNIVLGPVFGFSNPDAISVPITALGSTGASLGLIKNMALQGRIVANDVAVFTSICMCWSGFISTHIAMMDALGTKELTGKALLSHTVGGVVAGITAHLLVLLLL